MGAPHSKKSKNKNILPTEQSNTLPVETETEYCLTMLGSTHAGKTTLINSLINNKFDDSFCTSNTCEYSSKDIRINDKENIKLGIWDTIGREVGRKLMKNFIINGQIYIIVFDLKDKREIDEISYFFNMIKEVVEDYEEKPIFLIGNKCEKNDYHEREIIKEIGENFALKNNLFYFEVSAKRIRTLQKTFYIMMNIANDILKNRKKNQK